MEMVDMVITTIWCSGRRSRSANNSLKWSDFGPWGFHPPGQPLRKGESTSGAGDFDVTLDFLKAFIELQGILSYKGCYKWIYRVTRGFELQGIFERNLWSHNGFWVTMNFIKEFIELQRILSYEGFYKGIYRVTWNFEFQLIL